MYLRISAYTSKSGASKKKDCSYPAGKAWAAPGQREEQEERTERRGTDIRERREERELGLRQEEKERGERGTETEQKGKRRNLACEKRKRKEGQT